MRRTTLTVTGRTRRTAFAIPCRTRRTFLIATLSAVTLERDHAMHELRPRQQVIAILIKALEQRTRRRTFGTFALRVFASGQLADHHHSKKRS